MRKDVVMDVWVGGNAAIGVTGVGAIFVLGWRLLILHVETIPGYVEWYVISGCRALYWPHINN